MYDLYIFFEKRFLWQQYALQPRFCDEDGFNRQPLSFSTNFFDRLYRVLRCQKISPIVFCRWYFVSTHDKNFGSGDFMRRGRAPEYVFLAAVLQLQIAQEYLTLWRSVSGRYAAAVRRHLSAALAALYGSAGEAGCLAALRERCAKHPAFSGREGAQALARIDDLLRRYASLFPNTVSPAILFPETEQCIADTESALREIQNRLFAAADTQDGVYSPQLREHR